MKKKAPRNIAENAGRSIWNCKSSAVTGPVNPPFRYSTRSASQVSPNASPRNQATCGQLTLDGVIMGSCEVVCIRFSLSEVNRIN